MALVVLLALLVLFTTLIIHHNSHYHFDLYSKMHRSSWIEERQSTKCVCRLSAIDGENFNFFPKSFYLYVTFNIILSLMVIIDSILIDQNPFLFDYPITSNHNDSFTNFHSINTKSMFMDYILIYGIMILSIWESLFAFSRYYITYKTAIEIVSISTTKIFKKYSVYIIIFSVLFIVQIHLYFWTFIPLILMSVVFNLYCNWKFAAILVEKYKLFETMDESLGRNSDNEDVVQNVLFLRKISIICWILQTLSLAITIISYNINMIYYLPLIWSVSSVIYSMSFVRNRQYIKTKCNWFTRKINLIHQQTSENNTRPAIKVHIHSDHRNSLQRRGLQNVESNSVTTPVTPVTPVPVPIIRPAKSFDIDHAINLSIAEDVNTNTVNSIPDINEILNEPLPPISSINELPLRLTKSENNATASIPNKLMAPQHSSKSSQASALRLRNNKKLIPNLSVPILMENVPDHDETNVDINFVKHLKKFSEIQFKHSQGNDAMNDLGFKKNISAPVLFGAKNSKLDMVDDKKKKKKKHSVNASIDIPAISTMNNKAEENSAQNLTTRVHRISRSDPLNLDVAGTIRSLNSLRDFGFVCAVQESNLKNKLKKYQEYQERHRAFTK